MKKKLKIKKYKGNFFDTFFVTSDKAKLQAEADNCIIEFEFNGVNCRISKDTNSDWLWRDYCNAHLMKWKIVGPDCVEKYSSEIQAEYDRRKTESDIESAKQDAAYREKERRERESFNASVSGVELELSDPEGWRKSREVNTDGYGGAALDYAEGWAKLMQVEVAKGKTVAECYDYTQKGLGFFGITGFQFGCAVSTLSQTWKHGEELRKVHNKKYGVAEDKEGVVNPAILTIQTL